MYPVGAAVVDSTSASIGCVVVVAVGCVNCEQPRQLPASRRSDVGRLDGDAVASINLVDCPTKRDCVPRSQAHHTTTRLPYDGPLARRPGVDEVAFGHEGCHLSGPSPS